MTAPGALQQALRVLLETPLLQEDVDGFREVYAWRLEVRAWFARVAGWPVQVGPGVVRLVAAPEKSEGGRAFGSLTTARACAMLAWTLWFHEYLGLRPGEARQFSLSELSGAIAEPSGLDFSELTSRRALVQAVRALGELGALRLLDDQTQGWEGGAAQAGALLEFTAGAAYLISSPPELPPTPAQRAARALLIGPALLRADDPGAYAALEDGALRHELEETLGWALELHPSYATLLRGGQVRGQAARWSPGRSVVSAAALLLLGALRAEVEAGRLVPDAASRLRVSHNKLYGLLDAVRAEHRTRWGEGGKTGTERLLRDILALWRSWGGLTDLDDPSGVTIEPHLARFEAGYREEGRSGGRGRRVGTRT